MKLLANILFEILHREIYDNKFNQKPDRNLDLNKIERLYKLYNFIAPYFVGWRFSLRLNLPFVKKYKRYEPKNIQLMNYEYEKLGCLNKLIYVLFYKKEVKLKEEQ